MPEDGLQAGPNRLGGLQSQAISLLHYKLAVCIEVAEAYSSQTCPVCGERSKHRRIYRCRCGYVAPRDIVGCSNIRMIGIEGTMRPDCSVPNAVQWKYPAKYPSAKPGSPSDTGHVARERSREATVPRFNRGISPSRVSLLFHEKGLFNSRFRIEL